MANTRKMRAKSQLWGGRATPLRGLRPWPFGFLYRSLSIIIGSNAKVLGMIVHDKNGFKVLTLTSDISETRSSWRSWSGAKCRVTSTTCTVSLNFCTRRKILQEPGRIFVVTSIRARVQISIIWANGGQAESTLKTPSQIAWMIQDSQGSTESSKFV
jgi:hypothetical protein